MWGMLNTILSAIFLFGPALVVHEILIVRFCGMLPADGSGVRVGEHEKERE
jgi:hypothetical protein